MADYQLNASPGARHDNHEQRPVSPLSLSVRSSSPSRHQNASDSEVTINTANDGHAPEITYSKGYSQQQPPTIDDDARSYRIFGRWKWELCALALALGMLIAITVIMGNFNGQSVPDWGYSINLSTLLALLATIFRSAIVAIMAQIISQTKWVGYMTGTTPYPLQNLQDFDSASRGAWGSLALIPKVVRRNLLATAAALVTILSLAVGPMVQQSIKTISCARPTAVNTTGASIPFARFVPREGAYERLAQSNAYKLYDDARDAVRMALIRPTAAEQQVDSVLQCTTGNCTFPAGDPIEDGGEIPYTGEPRTSYSSVGLCSRCVNITSLLKVTAPTNVTRKAYALPNGLSVGSVNAGIQEWMSASYSNPLTNVSTSLGGGDIDWAGSLVPEEARYALLNFTIVALTQATCKPDGAGGVIKGSCPSFDPDYDGMGIIAATCPIYPCMRTYNTTVIDNKLQEDELPSVPMPLALVEGQQGIYDPYRPKNSSGQLELEYSARNSLTYPYVAIKSPCRAKHDPHVFYTMQNMSLAPNTTAVHLFGDLKPNGWFDTTKVMAPPECTYMHSVGLGASIGSELRTLLAGNCSSHLAKGNGRAICYSSIPAIDRWTYDLFNYRNATIQSVGEYMELFTKSMTNYYRMHIGSDTYDPNPNPRQDLTQSTILGTVWRTDICTSIQWEWIIFPASLAFLTVVLLAWTILRSWTRRHDEPVWKDNVLPAILYRERFETPEGRAVGPHGTTDHGPAEAVLRHQGNKLAETAEMEQMARNTLVSFQLPGKSAGTPEDPGLVGTDTTWTARRRKSRRVSLDSLLAR